MICKKCGSQLEDDSLFCGVCGERVDAQSSDSPAPDQPPVQANNQPFNPYGAQEEQNSGFQPQPFVNTGYQQNTQNAGYQQTQQYTQPNNVNIKIDKKKATIVGIAIGIAVAVIIGIVIVVSIITSAKQKAPVKIDLNDYVKSQVIVYEGNGAGEDGEYYNEDTTLYTNDSQGAGLIVNGYNNYASVFDYDLSNVVDWSSFSSGVAEGLNTKKAYQGYTYESLMKADEFVFKADKTDNLKNGDVVTVTVSMKSDMYDFDNDLHLEFEPATVKITISGLKDVNSFDPFNYVGVYLSGGNGNVELSYGVKEGVNEELDAEGFSAQDNDGELVLVKDGYIIAHVDFNWGEDTSSSGHSNGDVVTLECYCDESQSLIDDYNIYIVKYSKQYTVDGAGEYATKDFAMSSEDLKAFKENAKSVIDDELQYYEYKNVKFVSARLYDIKDKTTDSYEHNTLLLVYSYDYDDWGEEVTRYVYVTYDDIVEKDGKVCYTPATYEPDCSTSYEIEDIYENFSPDKYNYSEIE